MFPVGFELAVTAVERPQTYALERAGTGTCYHITGQKSQDVWLLTLEDALVSEVIFVIHWPSTGLGATIFWIHKRIVNKYNPRNLPVREPPATDPPSPRLHAGSV